MKPGLARFLSVFSLVSRIPLKVSFKPDYTRADFWLPLIGPFASLAALAGLSLGAFLFQDPWLAVLASMALQYGAFNLFHLDGLLDTADAMLPWAEPEKRLAILKDSRIGTYAFGVGLLCLGARAAAMVSLAGGSGAWDYLRPSLWDSDLLPALLVAPLAGRAASALVPMLTAPARPGGLGALMKGFSPYRIAFAFLLGLLPLGLWAILSASYLRAGIAGASALGAALGAGGLCARVYETKVRGFTGDALGAAVELGELGSLLILAAVLPRLGIA